MIKTVEAEGRPGQRRWEQFRDTANQDAGASGKDGDDDGGTGTRWAEQRETWGSAGGERGLAGTGTGKGMV